ncbi:tetratricopeptide repeat protein, partial [Curvibacter delicatus]|uniref:tetratricopeptide repeat protein n=1 Tax=Curvibacter delicatus TaxID=80879 RepID=UPI0012ED9FE2
MREAACRGISCTASGRVGEMRVESGAIHPFVAGWRRYSSWRTFQATSSMPIDSCDMTDITDPTSQGGRSVDDLLEQAIASHQAWKFDEAEASYRAVLALEPGNADACHNLGVLLAIQLLRPADALPYFEAALNADSARAQYWFSYIDALIRADQKALAQSLLPIAQSMGVQMAMVNALAERLAEAPQVLSTASPTVAAPVMEAGEPAAAQPQPKTEKKRKVRRAQEVSEADQVELIQLFRQRNWVAGEARARELIAQYPDSGFAWKSLGVMLHTQGKLDEALLAKRKSAQLLPLDPEVHCNLGHLLQEVGEFQAGLDALNRALKLKPNYPEAFNNLGITYQRLGEIDRSLAYFKKALELQPDNRIDFSNYLFTLNYHPDLSAEAVYEGYAEFDRRFGQPVRAQWRPHANPPADKRRLKVGYVSPDFRAHSTQNFMEPLLSQHDRSVVEVFAYATLAREDQVTQRYKSYVDHWVLTNGMSDEALAERIRADGIDVLVDVAGHSTG